MGKNAIALTVIIIVIQFGIILRKVIQTRVFYCRSQVDFIVDCGNAKTR